MLYWVYKTVKELCLHRHNQQHSHTYRYTNTSQFVCLNLLRTTNKPHIRSLSARHLFSLWCRIKMLARHKSWSGPGPPPSSLCFLCILNSSRSHFNLPLSCLSLCRYSLGKKGGKFRRAKEWQSCLVATTRKKNYILTGRFKSSETPERPQPLP